MRTTKYSNSISYIIFENTMKRPFFEDRKELSLSSKIAQIGFNTHKEMLQEEMLQEGLTAGILGDVLQWAIGAAAEYGLTAITLPIGGEGLIPGTAVKTIFDAIMAIDVMSAVVLTLKDSSSVLGDFSGTFKEIVEMVKKSISNPADLYEKIELFLISKIKLLGAGGTKAIDEFIAPLTDKIQNFVDAIVEPLTRGIKVIIPDPTAALSVTGVIKLIVGGLIKHPYTIITKILNAAGKYASFITDPTVAPAFMEDLIPQVISLLKEWGEKVDKMSWTSVIALAAATAGTASGPAAALKLGGKKIFDKLAEIFENNKNQLISVTKVIVETIIPSFFAAMAVLQFLVSGSYKKSLIGIEIGSKIKHAGKEKDLSDEQQSVAAENFIRKKHLNKSFKKKSFA